jgi:hypothetical protein
VDQAHGCVAGIIGVQVRRAARDDQRRAGLGELLGAIRDIGRAALDDLEALVECQMLMEGVSFLAAAWRICFLELEQLAAGLGAGLQHNNPCCCHRVGHNLS